MADALYSPESSHDAHDEGCHSRRTVIAFELLASLVELL